MIELIDEETKIRVSGTQMGLQQVRGKLEALERQVIVHEETVQEQAKVKFLNKRKYKGEVDDVSRINQCVLGREREPAGVQVRCRLFVCLFPFLSHFVSLFTFLSQFVSLFTFLSHFVSLFTFLSQFVSLFSLLSPFFPVRQHFR